MCALDAALAALVLATSAAADVPRDVRWILGPAAVELGQGRIRFALPGGVALASGTDARSILATVASGVGGDELAVLSPTAAARTWFVVVAWRAEDRSPARPPGRRGAGSPDRVVWLERPRRDDRTGRVTWAFAGPTQDGPIVNQHVRIPASGGSVDLTLVAPVEELSEARGQLKRIVDGLVVP